jgi:glutathione S-transferase
MRARLAIAVAGIECELREVMLRNKPPELIAISPKATVPVLQLDNRSVIDESLDIMCWALQHNDPEDWLPANDNHRNDAFALIRYSDTEFKTHLDRYKYPDRYTNENVVDHRAAGQAFIASLEERLSIQPRLCGERASIADYAILPFVRQFANADREWFDATPFPRVHRWLEDFLSSALFNAVMEKYTPWAAGEPGVLFRPLP